MRKNDEKNQNKFGFFDKANNQNNFLNNYSQTQFDFGGNKFD